MQPTFPRALAKSHGGLGIFATRDIKATEIIEMCPILKGRKRIKALKDYIFSDDKKKWKLPLGLCSLYNHHPKPSAKYTDRVLGKTAFKMIMASRDIKKGEEISIDYGSNWWKNREEELDDRINFAENDDLRESAYFYAPSLNSPGLYGIFSSKKSVRGETIDVCPSIYTINTDKLFWANCLSFSNQTAGRTPCPEDCSGHCYQTTKECKRCFDDQDFRDEGPRNDYCIEWRGSDFKSYFQSSYGKGPAEEEWLQSIRNACPWASGLCDLEEIDRTYIVMGNCFVCSSSETEANIEMKVKDIDGRKIFEVVTLRDIGEYEEYIMKPVNNNRCRLRYRKKTRKTEL